MSGLLRLVGEERLGSGSFLHLDQLVLAAPDGSEVRREVVRHPGAVAFLPVDGDDVVLIRQYRVAVGEDVLEMPAGKLDGNDEALLEAVERESIEEIGYRPGTIRELGWVYASPGFTDERMYLYEVTDLEPVGTSPEGIEEEHAEVVRLPFSEALRMAREGSIVDAKTRLAIALVALGAP